MGSLPANRAGAGLLYLRPRFSNRAGLSRSVVAVHVTGSLTMELIRRPELYSGNTF